MYVALLSAEYPPQPGGVGDYTQRLGQALIRRGHTVTVLTGVGDRPPRIGDHDEPPVVELPISSWDWRCWSAISAALEQLRPEVLHIQYQTGAYAMHPAINLLPWRLRWRSTRPALVVTAHDLLPPYLFPKAGPLRHWVTRRLLADADATIMTNEDDLARVVGEWGIGSTNWTPGDDAIAATPNPQPPTLVPIGSNIPVTPPESYDRSAWRMQLGVAAGEALVAYFGLISRTKGLDVLLDALVRLPQRFRLLVIGGEATAPADRAFAAQLRRRIESVELHDRVIVTGHCSAAQVSGGLLAADLAALPFVDGASFRRGSLLATLAHGVPTVTTRPLEPIAQSQEASARKVLAGAQLAALKLVDGENVLLTPPGDSTALAAALLRLIDDAVLRERLRARGRALAAQFSWEEIAARHEALYRAAVQR